MTQSLDFACEFCGYPLTESQFDAACPECGATRVERAERVERFEIRVKMLRVGRRCMLVASVGLFAAGLLGGVLPVASSLEAAAQAIFHLGMALAGFGVLTIVAACLMLLGFPVRRWPWGAIVLSFASILTIPLIAVLLVAIAFVGWGAL